MLTEQQNKTIEAKRELARRELARRHFMPFVQYMFPGYEVNWHHQVIADRLERLVIGSMENENFTHPQAIRRLIISMPPRHGKSELASIHFPAWFLAKFPNKEIIATSYGADLATDFGRKVRNMFEKPEMKNLFPAVRLAPDSKAADKWNTNLGGAYVAAGVGGAITGKGADLLIVDDPIKNAQEAMSEQIRQQKWEWLWDVAMTRLSKNGVVVLIMCMTGDTRVLMEDGTEKLLKDIRVGDRIATWDNGKLSSSVVKNWANQGRDLVFTITTSSGKVFKANERHPFLINSNGKLSWVRVKDLNIGQKIVTLRDSGENGKEKTVWKSVVKNRSAVGDIVRRITIKKSGPMDIVLRPSIIGRVATRILNIGMGLRSMIMMLLSKSKMVNVLSANDQKEKAGAPITNTSALTTTITQGKFEDSSAMSATSLLDMRKLKQRRWLWRNTSDFTLDDIVSIEQSGEEEVFDIEVEKTHNFIANGVVSSNTRWHDDDFVGRIHSMPLISTHPWHELKFPAIAVKSEHEEIFSPRTSLPVHFYRSPGEALWPNRYSVPELESRRNGMSKYSWSALFQQDPVDEESIEFKKEWFKTRTESEVAALNTRCFITIDAAGSMTDRSDFIGVVHNRVDQQGKWNIKARQYRMNSNDLILFIITQWKLYHPEVIGIEKGIYTSAIKPFLEMEMEKQGLLGQINIVELSHQNIAKPIRIRGLIPYYQSGKIYHIEGECDDLVPQLVRFPKGVKDDILDAESYQLQVALQPFGSDGDMQSIGEPQSEADFDRHSPVAQI